MTASFPVLSDVLISRRKPLLVWALSLGSVTGLYTGLYPMMEDMNIQDMIDSMPAALIEALGYDDMATAAGYFGSATYGMVALALLLVFSIGNGAKILAGHEEDGSLELEFASPLSRSAIYSQRLAALWVQITALVCVVFAVTLGFDAAQSLGVPRGDLLAGTLGLWLLSGLFGSIAFAVGAASGRHAMALGVAAAVAVTGWMLNAIGPTLGLHWMAAISPIGWYMADNPLTRGFHGVDTALLAASSAVVLGLGWVRFVRRDLMT